MHLCYIAASPLMPRVGYGAQDWLDVDLLFSSTDFSAGHLNLDIWATCRHPAQDIMIVYGAKSSLLLFIHSYMQSAGIDYVKPLLPTRIEGGAAPIEHQGSIAGLGGFVLRPGPRATN